MSKKKLLGCKIRCRILATNTLIFSAEIKKIVINICLNKKYTLLTINFNSIVRIESDNLKSGPESIIYQSPKTTQANTHVTGVN